MYMVGYAKTHNTRCMSEKGTLVAVQIHKTRTMQKMDTLWAVQVHTKHVLLASFSFVYERLSRYTQDAHLSVHLAGRYNFTLFDYSLYTAVTLKLVKSHSGVDIFLSFSAFFSSLSAFSCVCPKFG